MRRVGHSQKSHFVELRKKAEELNWMCLRFTRTRGQMNLAQCANLRRWVQSLLFPSPLFNFQTQKVSIAGIRPLRFFFYTTKRRHACAQTHIWSLQNILSQCKILGDFCNTFQAPGCHLDLLSSPLARAAPLSQARARPTSNLKNSLTLRGRTRGDCP